MRGRSTRGIGLRLALAGALVALAAAALPSSAGAVASIFDNQSALPDIDPSAQPGTPSAAQRSAVKALGAHATWNGFGTPASLINYGGYLGSRPAGAATSAARSWIAAHRTLFKLSAADVSALDVASDSPLVGTSGHAVIFNQRFGNLVAGQNGMVTVGINDRGVFYASSSAAGSQPTPAPATLSPTAAWRAAASNVGLGVGSDAISGVTSKAAVTTFDVDGLTTPLVPGTKGGLSQSARLVAFPTPDGVHSAYETTVIDDAGGALTAYKSMVDARTGEVLFRQNAVDQLAAADANDTFSGTTVGTGHCGPRHAIPVDAGIHSIFVIASANTPANDIVLKLIDPSGTVVVTEDTGTSPEAIQYSKPNGAALAVGTWKTQVCQFDPTVAAFPYTGTWATNSAPVNETTPDPEWQYFEANPPLDYSNTDSRIVGCWIAQDGLVPPCDRVEGNLASRAPWDVAVGSGTTMTTLGNNAKTAEDWTNPVAPGPTGFMPTAADRKYAYDWSNQWQTSGCNPTVLVPGGNDISASVTNLFVGHNRFHDFSYRLGFTEDNFNLQTDNFGSVGGRGGDPEIGDVQAGAITGGFPSFEGRDNANQLTLNDGTPGITNQYLFQPIAGAFYSPCVDGDFDTSVFGHEYTHAISNRMVGGPDSELTGAQAGAMGESWSDLDALEYLHEYGYVPTDGENDWAEGPYVTGNKERGIRDFALNDSPLTFGDIGFDVTGPEVHADGEIWNAVNYDIRQALVHKYNVQFPSTDATLQRRCAEGDVPVDLCPGNRRWIQLVYDAFLLQQPATSMLDARDAMLAAEVNRFGGNNLTPIWNAFAKRGFGLSARDSSTDEDQPRPGFDSPEADNATVTFRGVKPDGHAFDTRFFVGSFEARATPAADTIADNDHRNATIDMEPGTYHMLAQSRGYGIRPFTLHVTPGETVTKTVPLLPNWSSSWLGATATGDGTAQAKLLDDKQATQWNVTGLPTNVDVAKPSVTVDLAGGAHTVRSVQVSSLLSPGQGRFTALRRFRIDTCAAGPGVDCSSPADFSPIYTSPPDAFPGVAPRPVAPDLILRTFDVPDTLATHVRLVALENQCTGGPDYAGEQDNDPINPTDCATGSDAGTELHAAELEVRSTDSP